MINHWKKSVSRLMGKVCTIITVPHSVPIKDAVQHSQYFTGEVYEVDDLGVWIKHPINGASSFFAFPFLGIVEEPVILSTDSRYEKVKEQLEAKNKPKIKDLPQPQGQFISTDELTEKLKKANASMSS
jgi:hypothetical protein